MYRSSFVRLCRYEFEKPLKGIISSHCHAYKSNMSRRYCYVRVGNLTYNTNDKQLHYLSEHI